MNQPGTLDTSFLITGADIDGEVNVIKVLSDNSILIGGKFGIVSGHTTDSIAKLNPDGSVDTTFTSLLDNGQVFDIAVDDYGIIWVAGNFTSYNGTGTNYLIKLNSDGTLNQYFSTLFTPGKGLYTLKIQSNGKVLCGGEFTDFSGNSSSNIVRLNNNGTEDITFTSNIGTGFDNDVNDIEIESDGNILIGGQFTQLDGNSVGGICRLDSDGNLLPSFGSGLDNICRKILIQPDEKIILGGAFNYFDGTYTPNLVRITKSGIIDTTFNLGDILSLFLQNDGRIIVGDSSRNFLRLNPSGTLDGSWYNSYPNNNVNDIVGTIDGKILIGGNFGSVDDVEQQYLARLFNDDSTYQYQYIYEAYSCLDFTNSTQLYIGSDIELNQNDVVYSQNLIQQSRFGCMVIFSTSNIYANIDWRYISSYDDCTSCLSSTTFTATTNECRSGEGPELFIVSNQFQVGDIFSIDGSITIEGDVYNLSGCFEITSLGLINPDVFNIYDYLNNFFIQSEVPYFPRESCESCYSCNGIWYRYEDCTNSGDTGIIAAVQFLPEGQCFYLPYGTTSCKKIVSQENLLINGQVNFNYIGGQLYDSCEMCSEDESSTLCTFQLCGLLFENVTGYTLVSNTLINNVNMGRTNSFCFQITGIADIETITEGSIFIFGDVITEFYSGDCTTCNTLVPVTLMPCNGGEPIYTRINETTLVESSQSYNTIFSLGPQCYSFFSECSFSNITSLTYPNSSFATCEICNQPLSAGTEYSVCVVCSPCGSCSGTVTSVPAPHPTWTDPSGKSIVLLDAVTLGGPNGLNN